MVQLFENFTPQVNWRVGDLAMIVIDGDQTCYFMTDKNRPAHRPFSILEAIIKLQAIDKSTNTKWIGEIVWVGRANVNGPANQILGTSIITAMKPGSGSNGGRKINRLIVDDKFMAKNEQLALDIMKADTSVFKSGKTIPLDATLYNAQGNPMQGGLEHYTSSSYPIDLKGSIKTGKIVSKVSQNKEIYFDMEVFVGDSSAITYDSYIRMLNQTGLVLKKDGDERFSQTIETISKTVSFENSKTAWEYKTYIKEAIKRFPKIHEDVSNRFNRTNDAVFDVDDDGFRIKYMNRSLNPVTLKQLAKEHLNDDIEDKELMGGEDAVTNLFERSKK